MTTIMNFEAVIQLQISLFGRKAETSWSVSPLKQNSKMKIQVDNHPRNSVTLKNHNSPILQRMLTF